MILVSIKRRVAQWALKQLDPELGEWRTCKGTHWQLVTMNLRMGVFDGSELELRYVQPAASIVWPADIVPMLPGDWPTFPDVPGHELLPGDWRVPDR